MERSLAAASVLLLALYASSTGSLTVVLQPQPEFVEGPWGTGASYRAVLPLRVEVGVPLLLPPNTTVTVEAGGADTVELGPGGVVEVVLYPGSTVTVNATI